MINHMSPLHSRLALDTLCIEPSRARRASFEHASVDLDGNSTHIQVSLRWCGILNLDLPEFHRRAMCLNRKLHAIQPYNYHAVNAAATSLVTYP